MTRDLRPARPEPVDDAAIEQLIRDVASSWTMPPVRLDAPAWRDRVRSPRARRLEAARGWFGRVGQAATAAVALTVVAALVAVMVTRPPVTPGKSAEPSEAGATPGPTAAAFSPLPKRHLDGELPTPSSFLTAIEEGDYAVVDLATGTRGPSLTSAAYGSVLRRRPDGTLLCLCVKLGADVNTRPTEAEITLDRLDAAGNLISTFPVMNLKGDPDPRDGALQERPSHLNFDLRFSDGGAFAFIGWSVRKHPVWQSGITVVNVLDGTEVSRIDLPDDTSGEGDTRRVVFAPRLLGTGADGVVVIAREWYSWSPPESQGYNYRQETDAFTAKLGAGELSNVAPMAAAAGCGERVVRAGDIDGAGSWLLCYRAFTNQVVVRRLDAAGGELGDTTVSAATGVGGDTTALAPDGDAIYLWDPIAWQLVRVDLATGEKVMGQAPTARGPEAGPLAALGGWLAPTVAAKTFLFGGIVVSPDGKRVYAAGVNGAEDEHGMSGSAGIFVFDGSTLANLGHWEPTADFISLAISVDGRYVYASGLPRIDASGEPRPEQQASMTVFSAADGTIRVIAGELGGKFLAFEEQVLD